MPSLPLKASKSSPLHYYETYLDILNGGGSIRIHWNANYSNLFNATGNGQFTSTDLPTEYDRLVKNADGSYTLTRKDQSVYQFNSSGRLTKIQNGHGQELDMTYDGSNQLVAVTEPVSGQFLSFSYNSNNLIDAVADNLGRRVSFTYDANSNLTGITDANGNKTTYAYTPQGYVQSGTDNNGLTLFTDTYDSSGRVIAQWDGVQGHQPGAFSYDETSRPGYIITTYTDRDGNTRTLVHDSNYNLVSETDQLGNTTTNSYDAYGNCTSTTDPLNHTTTSTYDSSGNLLTTTDPAGKTTTNTYDANNNVTSITDALNNKTTKPFSNCSLRK